MSERNHWTDVTRTTTLVVALLAVVGLSAVAGVADGAGAQDDWPSECAGADGAFQNATGTYDGTIDVPVDQDALQFELDRGEFVTVSPLVPEAHGRFVVTIYPVEGPERPGSVMLRNETFEDGVFIESGRDNSSTSDIDEIPVVVSETANGSESTWEIWANEDSILCIQVAEDTPNAAELPYEWQLSLVRNSPTTDRPGHQVLSPDEVQRQREELDRLGTRVDELETRVDDLESRVDEQDSRIEDLESRVDEQESTVADHEERIRELERNRSDQSARHPRLRGSGPTGGDDVVGPLVAAGLLLGVATMGLYWRT